MLVQKSAFAILLGCVLMGPLHAQVVDKIDWKSFLARHDMVWKRLPDRFENAAFTGNGRLRSMLFTADKGQSITWHSDRRSGAETSGPDHLRGDAP